MPQIHRREKMMKSLLFLVFIDESLRPINYSVNFHSFDINSKPMFNNVKGLRAHVWCEHERPTAIKAFRK